MTAISSDLGDSTRSIPAKGATANGNKANGHARVHRAGPRAAEACEPDATASQRPHRVLVVGGAYAGVAAVLTLLDGADGKLATGEPPLPRLRRRIEVTLIDERDGFCTLSFRKCPCHLFCAYHDPKEDCYGTCRH